MESFPRTCIETTGPNVFQNLYVTKICYCVHKAPPLVPILLDWSLSSTTDPHPPPLVTMLHLCSVSSNTGLYPPLLVHILHHWSLFSTTGPYPPPMVPIFYHWSLSSITGPYHTPMVPTLQYFSDIHFKNNYPRRIKIYNTIFCLSSQQRSINV